MEPQRSASLCLLIICSASLSSSAHRVLWDMEGGPKQRVLTSSSGEAKPISWSWESVGVGNGMGVGDRGVGYGVGVGGGGGNEAYMPVVGIPSGDNWIGSGVGVGIGRGSGLGSSGGPGYSEGSREGSGLGGGSGFSEARGEGSGSGGGYGYGEGVGEGSESSGGSGFGEGSGFGSGSSGGFGEAGSSDDLRIIGDFPGVLHTGHIVGNGKGSSDGTGFGEGYGVGMGSSSVGTRGQPVVSLPTPGSATSQDCRRMRQSVGGGDGGPSQVGQCNMDIHPGIPQFGMDLRVPIGKWKLLQNGEPEQNGHKKPMNNVHHHKANRARLDDERHKMSMASEPLPPRAPVEEPIENEN